MNKSAHQFHIPVMGLGFTIDTPAKVARFGISSVLSIVEDNIIEQMREFYCEQENETYIPITKKENDYRAKRITAYLDLLNNIVNRQIDQLRSEDFVPGNDIYKYFTMLPEDSSLKALFNQMLDEEDINIKYSLQQTLRNQITPGPIDVNIMTKCDRTNYDKNGEALPAEYSDAMAALRGFANSTLNASVIFSAGMNPRLYAYCETFTDFYADENGHFKKKIILKVSDYRSALIQGKFLAKKGLWISEYRIESGLNCGGHAFATDGYLLGPIMEEFKNKRAELTNELFEIYKASLQAKEFVVPNTIPGIRIAVQGGIGTHLENKFLLEYYNLDATGWGSPFLLVPEATNVDEETLNDLCNASPSDYYLSHASPLGVPFNNFKRSSSEKQRKQRIEKGRPGSPCYKKFLAFNTEFTDKPICTASRQYQNLKINQLQAAALPEEKLKEETEKVLEKDCLCEGLAVPALIKNKRTLPHNLSAVSICPGPNLAYFSGIFSLHEMVDHIYGRRNILNDHKRPSVFLKELRLYADYLQKEMGKTMENISSKQQKYFADFKSNLLKGIEYYTDLIPKMKTETGAYLNNMVEELNQVKKEIEGMMIPQTI